jgi:hypothetical protein
MACGHGPRAAPQRRKRPARKTCTPTRAGLTPLKHVVLGCRFGMTPSCIEPTSAFGTYTAWTYAKLGRDANTGLSKTPTGTPSHCFQIETLPMACCPYRTTWATLRSGRLMSR